MLFIHGGNKDYYYQKYYFSATLGSNPTSDKIISVMHGIVFTSYEHQHEKTNKMSVRPAKTPISLGIRPVWSESSLSAWRNLGSLDTHWAHSEDSDQTGRMPRLIWVFAGRTLILLVLSCRGSYNKHFFSHGKIVVQNTVKQVLPCWHYKFTTRRYSSFQTVLPHFSFLNTNLT